WSVAVFLRAGRGLSRDASGCIARPPAPRVLRTLADPDITRTSRAPSDGETFGLLQDSEAPAGPFLCVCRWNNSFAGFDLSCSYLSDRIAVSCAAMYPSSFGVCSMANARLVTFHRPSRRAKRHGPGLVLRGSGRRPRP